MKKALIALGVGYVAMIPVGGPLWPYVLPKWAGEMAQEYRAIRRARS